VLLLPPNLREWLPVDHLAWFVLAAVEEIEQKVETLPSQRRNHARQGSRKRKTSPRFARDTRR
jgi:hypothetical protein